MNHMQDDLKMLEAVFQETDAIHKEIDQLIGEGEPSTIEERENMKKRFQDVLARSADAVKRIQAAQEAILNAKSETDNGN